MHRKAGYEPRFSVIRKILFLQKIQLKRIWKMVWGLGLAFFLGVKSVC